MGNVTVERTAGSQEVEIILTENVYQATVEEGLLVVRPLKSAGAKTAGTGTSCSICIPIGIGT